MGTEQSLVAVLPPPPNNSQSKLWRVCTRHVNNESRDSVTSLASLLRQSKSKEKHLASFV